MDLLFAAWRDAPNAPARRRAEERLLAAARPILLRSAAVVVGEQGAEDAAQDALVRLVSYGLAQFRGDGPFVAYLAKIARNCALNALRKDRGYKGRAGGPLEVQQSARIYKEDQVSWEEMALPDGGPADAESAEEQLLRAENRGRLLVGLEILARRRPRWGRLLREHYLEGRSLDAIAEHDRITNGPNTSNVRVLLHRARKCLAGILAELDEKEAV